VTFAFNVPCINQFTYLLTYLIFVNFDDDDDDFIDNTVDAEKGS